MTLVTSFGFGIFELPGFDIVHKSIDAIAVRIAQSEITNARLQGHSAKWPGVDLPDAEDDLVG